MPKGIAGSSRKSTKTLGKVCVDWHNTLEKDGEVPLQNFGALVKLYEIGYEIVICSWCFKDRAKEVKKHVEALKGPWERLEVYTTEKRTGPGGKVDLAKGWKCKAIFDDAADICQESVRYCIPAFPINTKWEKHQWTLEKGMVSFPTFSEAVEAFLAMMM